MMDNYKIKTQLNPVNWLLHDSQLTVKKQLNDRSMTVR